jgi:hypothetical protein
MTSEMKSSLLAVIPVGAKLEKNEWLVQDLAKKLNASKTNLHRWIKLGWIHSRRLPGLQGTVIC